MTSLQDRIGLHTWTLDTTPLADVLRIARDAGYAAVELRYADYERALAAGMSREEYVKMVNASGIKVGCVGVENNLIYASGEERERLLKSFELSCEIANAVGCATLMISPGRNKATTPAEASANLRTAGELARRHDLRLALEFNSRHPVLNRIAVAREIIKGAGVPNCGILLDAYHLHFSGARGRGFEQVPAEEIMAFQFSDAPPGPPAEGASATDRLPPGKGVIDWKGVFGLLSEKGYTGYIVYEAPNPAQWNRPAEEVAREGISAARELIANALQS
jgi:sugar phosphate isomerase/epimerase